MSDFATIHRSLAATFTDKVKGTTDWDAPAPCEGWTARSVVEHLVTWFPAFLAGGSEVRLPKGPGVEEHPEVAWELQRDAVQAILDDPARAGLPFTAEGVAADTVGEVINQYYTSDLLIHIWDLARATGQGDRLDPGAAEAALAAMEPIENQLRASGHFGTARGPLRDDADATDRLISFTGRDPYWRSPADD
ncbi:MAG: TIGR03086 family protein [Propionibacterium sp.]|nr:TIGR03086 family protein [Propionibacterium sp.]